MPTVVWIIHTSERGPPPQYNYRLKERMKEMFYLAMHSTSQFQLGLTCTFRASCYSTRLSWAHTPVIAWAVCLGQKGLVVSSNLLEGSEKEEGVVALHSVMEPVPRCEPSTYQSISHCAIGASMQSTYFIYGYMASDIHSDR